MHKSTASKIDQMRRDLSAIMAANGVLERVLRAHPYLEKHIKESCHGSLSVDKNASMGAIFITVGQWPEYSREMYAAEREVNKGASEYAIEQFKEQGSSSTTKKTRTSTRTSRTSTSTSTWLRQAARP
jgi:hypothetical protein